jgi:anti-sigma28 factor (negative regulator of flagellin synthesis)
MGQININSMPDYVSNTRGPGAHQVKATEGVGEAATAAAVEANPPQDALQLTRLSGVLNSFKKSATAVRSQVTQVMNAVRGGTYQVDSMAVSRSIVGDALAQH